MASATQTVLAFSKMLFVPQLRKAVVQLLGISACSAMTNRHGITFLTPSRTLSQITQKPFHYSAASTSIICSLRLPLVNIFALIN